MTVDVNSVNNTSEELRKLERRRSEVAQMVESMLAERNELDKQIRILSKTTREHHFLSAGQIIQSRVRHLGYKDFEFDGKVAYKMASLYAERVLSKSVPPWPYWDNGKPVCVQPPVKIRIGDDIHECCRLCYDGGMWFLLDRGGKAWLSRTVGSKFPSRFIPDLFGNEVYVWDAAAGDWVLNDDEDE